MENHTFYGVLTSREEFLYPDSSCSVLPTSLCLAAAQNGLRGIQVLLKTSGDTVKLHLESESFEPQWYRMVKVPVEYNTGDGVEQGGGMVLESRPAEKPAYATRLAPFWVYDCLAPAAEGMVQTADGLAAVYFCLHPKRELAAGEHTALLSIETDEGRYTCTLTIQVYPVNIPAETFPVTNWFSLDAICRFHQVERDTPEFYAVLKEYALAMRRARQTLFYLELDDTCVIGREPYTFDFEYLRPIIETFFSAGMQQLEIGPLLSRGFLPDGMPDMYTDRFKCAMAPQVPVDTPEGYAITVRFVQALAAFLTKYNWHNRVVFHVHDEPDIHAKSPGTIEARKQQYYLAVNILRKYLPGVHTIEAVSSAEFRGGVDIWVPGTPGYEEQKEKFDHLIGLGEEVWTYVCCGPEGHWLNRFLDFAVLKSRLLFWGCAKNRISGFLHWGFNQFPMGMDPFKGTSCPNHTGIGTNFPCGDSFIAYPGKNGPWIGMRLEAQRRGAEDAELLKLLRQKDEARHDELVGRVFTNNYTYNDDPVFFETVYEELLQALSDWKE
ncbi:DUF4091 domain-containing protein [Hydrogenoanaerobacterium sp.]|uniref:DUF4091 domain-containing protein n=1 Tax=Hydrogenoanaerobacterium sp. TaxID=2953763 RepID=UPI00289A4F5B|nr:DUF4091 domain-containing protein [Hydrogenoanaerobacterium sp.]